MSGYGTGKQIQVTLNDMAHWGRDYMYIDCQWTKESHKQIHLSTTLVGTSGQWVSHSRVGKYSLYVSRVVILQHP